MADPISNQLTSMDKSNAPKLPIPSHKEEKIAHPTNPINKQSSQQPQLISTTGIPVIPEDKKSKSIGHYILGKKLGEGTFGKVKLATHVFTGEKVAIKILEKERIIDVADVERVSREIHILKLLRHSNIIQLYEIIETPNLLFLIMEYASGGELFDYIVANQRVKEKEAARFFLQIISGIEYIHKLNIVHRDMKPENLLLNHDKSIKIVDFGLSNTYKKNELLKTACGSPCYAAPEMIAGKRYHGLGVDVWSCGVILYALLCGYLPFEDANTANLYKKILAGDFTIPKSISNEARDLLTKILNTDPQKRFSIDEIRSHPWCNQYRLNKTPEGIIVGYNRIPVDESILKQLANFSFNLDFAQKCIDANKHNHVTTCYYLLLKKHIAAGGKSVAHIDSDDFDSSLLVPLKRPRKSPQKEHLVREWAKIGDDEKENDGKVQTVQIRHNSSMNSHNTSIKNTPSSHSDILQSNTAAQNQKNYISMLDTESAPSSKYGSYLNSKRNSIQTNKLNFTSESTASGQSKPASNGSQLQYDLPIAQKQPSEQPMQINYLNESKVNHNNSNQMYLQYSSNQQQQLKQNYVLSNSAHPSPVKQQLNSSTGTAAMNSTYHPPQAYMSLLRNPQQPTQSHARNSHSLNETAKSSCDTSFVSNNKHNNHYENQSYTNSPRNSNDFVEKYRRQAKEQIMKKIGKQSLHEPLAEHIIDNSQKQQNLVMQQFNIPGSLGQRMRFANLKKNPINMNGNLITPPAPQPSNPSRGGSQGRDTKATTIKTSIQNGGKSRAQGEKKIIPTKERERVKSTEPLDDSHSSGYRINGWNPSVNPNQMILNHPTLSLNSSHKNQATNQSNISYDHGNAHHNPLSHLTDPCNMSDYISNGFVQNTNQSLNNTQHRRGKSNPLQNIINKLEKQKQMQNSFNTSMNMTNTSMSGVMIMPNTTTATSSVTNNNGYIVNAFSTKNNQPGMYGSRKQVF